MDLEELRRRRQDLTEQEYELVLERLWLYDEEGCGPGDERLGDADRRLREVREAAARLDEEIRRAGG